MLQIIIKEDGKEVKNFKAEHLSMIAKVSCEDCSESCETRCKIAYKNLLLGLIKPDHQESFMKALKTTMYDIAVEFAERSTTAILKDMEKGDFTSLDKLIRQSKEMYKGCSQN